MKSGCANATAVPNRAWIPRMLRQIHTESKNRRMERGAKKKQKKTAPKSKQNGHQKNKTIIQTSVMGFP